jgi:D-lactate dehydrogenase (cytochrome)
MLLMEFHGSPAGVKEQTETVQAIAAEHGGAGFEWADTPEERTRLWTARHNAYFAGVQSRPGCRCITTDVCVPISRLADALLDSVRSRRQPHPLLPGRPRGRRQLPRGLPDRPDDDAERARAEQLNRQVVARAWRWAAPAAASTAWACTRWASCWTRPAPARWT